MPKSPLPKLESLESRRLFSIVFPTNQEQYMVELINRARASPAAEAARYNINLNEGVPSNETISTSPKQPLAINPNLTDGARSHSQWMIDTDTFSHTGKNNSNPGQRMSAAGYNFTGSYAWGENIAYRSYNGSPTTSLLTQLHQDLFVDSGIANRGHRTNIMAPNFKEIGPGYVTGQFKNFSAGMITTDFANVSGNSFLTGVVYSDTITPDKFYTPGEGLAGVSITATRASDGATYAIQSWPSGGYSLQVPAGTYTLTAAGGPLKSPLTQTVSISSSNVKADFTPGVSTTPADTTPPTATLTKALRLRTVSKYYDFVITYTDNTAINPASFNNQDILITGPSGFTKYATFGHATPTTASKTITATYTIRGPGGTWDTTDNGQYTLYLQNNQIIDTNNNPAKATQLGKFTVIIPAIMPALVPALKPFAITRSNLRDLFQD